MPNWTKEQLEAIEKTGNNIIVSAGAGSGKTAVLSERVIRKLEQNIHINELLILTFTNAAAFEMKERIKSKISKIDSLKEELKLIDNAYITTFDSFSLSIVKKYGYKLNISPSIKVIDNSIIKIVKQNSIDDVFNTLYKNQDGQFLEMIKELCLKDDTEIKKYILGINEKLNLKFNKEDYLNNYITNFFNEKKLDMLVSKYIEILNSKIELIKEYLEDLKYYVDGNYYTKTLSVLDGLFKSNTYEEIKNNLKITLPKKNSEEQEEAESIKKNIKETIKELSDLTYLEYDELKRNILKTKKYIEVIIKIINKLDKKVLDYKFKNDYYEFIDIEKLAMKIVKNNGDVKQDLKESFKEIMIDEYQDTNDLQEEFISTISSNNVYMVGDIKQSIYRFRNANPYIFKQKYDQYKNNQNGYKIDLNKNFRTRKESLDDINNIFNLIMNNKIGGADYEKEHQMIFGNTLYLENNIKEYNENIEIFNYKIEDTKYTKEEIEAFKIVEDIKEKMNSKYQVFDTKTSKLRDITYNDFVILIDRASSFELYRKIFEYCNLPLTIHTDENLKNDIDLYLIKNIISLIIKIKDNKFDQEFRYYFISIARSYLFELKDNEILKIFDEFSYKETDLYQAAASISNLIDNTSSDEIIKIIIEKFNIYEKLIKKGNIQTSLTRFEYIIQMAKNTSDLGYTIKDFIEYLNKILETDDKITYKLNLDKPNSIKIMTIHKSKGLEYPICYFPAMTNSFNLRDIKELITYDETYGIICPYYNEGVGQTILKTLLKEKYIEEEISEKLRLFYVAITRAREKIIIITNIKENNYLQISNPKKLKYRSFKDILESIYSKIKQYIKEIDLEKLNISKDYNQIKEINYKQYIKDSNEIIKEETIEIRNTKETTKKFSKETNSLITKEIKNNLEYGLYVHSIFEMVDFKNINKLPLTEEETNLVQKFLNHDELKNISVSNIYKEYEFMYENNDTTYHGIIDLMLEYKDKIQIIDYKLKNIKDDNYKKQLEGYKTYIEEITNKPVTTYLYSILDNILIEI